MPQQSAGGRRNPTRPPRLPSIPTFPKGPRYLDFSNAPKIGGPGEPPPGFITPSNSKIEWLVYWGLAKVFGLPKDPRRKPYIGSHGLWEYQRPYGNHGAPGSTTIDFVIWPNTLTRGRPIALRIITERYHLFVDPRKRAKDTVQELNLARRYEIKDVFEQYIIHDKTGQATVKHLKFLLAGGSAPDPFAGRYAERIPDRSLT